MKMQQRKYKRRSFEPKVFPSLLSAPSIMGHQKLSIVILQAIISCVATDFVVLIACVTDNQGSISFVDTSDMNYASYLTHNSLQIPQATLRLTRDSESALYLITLSIITMSEAPFDFLQCDAKGCNKSYGLKKCESRGEWHVIYFFNTL